MVGEGAEPGEGEGGGGEEGAGEGVGGAFPGGGVLGFAGELAEEEVAGWEEFVEEALGPAEEIVFEFLVVGFEDDEAGFLVEELEGGWAEVEEVAGDVEVEPVFAGEGGLPALGVGEGDEEEAGGFEEGVEGAERGVGVGHVFEAMPEGDGVEGAGWVECGEILEDFESWLLCGEGVEFGAGDGVADFFGGEEEGAFAAADVEEGGVIFRVDFFLEEGEAAVGAECGGEAVALAVVILVVGGEVCGRVGGESEAAVGAFEEVEVLVGDGVGDLLEVGLEGGLAERAGRDGGRRSHGGDCTGGWGLGKGVGSDRGSKVAKRG